MSPRPDPAILLHEFIEEHRDEIIRRARAKVSTRAHPPPTTHELTNGIPLFLTQLGAILRQKIAPSIPDAEMGMSATLHGGDLLASGFTISEVVHDYGDLCQAITELATHQRLPISSMDFHTLNRCLDDAIASAVTEYSRRHDEGVSDAEVRRQGYLVHELRNHLNTASLAFQVVKTGKVGIAGSTFEMLERSLGELRELINRSVSEVRTASETYQRRRLQVAEFIEELAIVAIEDAARRGLQFRVEHADQPLWIEVDPHLLASALSNLLQNAFKYTRPSSRVWLRILPVNDRVWLEIEDECGGLPSGVEEAIFQPFEQRAVDRSGLGLGLAISRHAVEACGGRLSVRDLPGTGCVFTIDLPLAVDQAGDARLDAEEREPVVVP
jgi:signal transduction histidine kinase